jgi:predicted nucleic-acid-binding Zn-ribbon protein
MPQVSMQHLWHWRNPGVGRRAVGDVRSSESAFSYVTCKRCRCTEFYQTELSSLQKALDLFVG